MKSFAVGLKLMGEVLLENKDIPLFKDFLPQFIEFIKSINDTYKSSLPQVDPNKYSGIKFP